MARLNYSLQQLVSIMEFKLLKAFQFTKIGLMDLFKLLERMIIFRPLSKDQATMIYQHFSIHKSYSSA